MYLIARGNHLHWSLQFAQLLVALAKKARYHFKKHQGLFEIPLYVFQKVGRGFKIVGQLFRKVGPAFQKRGRCSLKSWW
jgi:hypothetical protein